MSIVDREFQRRVFGFGALLVGFCCLIAGLFAATLAAGTSAFVLFALALVALTVATVTAARLR